MGQREATDFAALDAVYPLPFEALYRQWALSQDAAALPEAWTVRELAGWHLAAHPDAHVCELLARDGAALGWAIEPLLHVTHEGTERPGGRLTLPVGAGATADEAERALFGRDEGGFANGTGLQGMWIAVLPGLGRVYPGPIHSVVYHPARRTVATSHNLLGPVERDMELSCAFDPLATFGFYSFGLTAFRDVRRLLPNHYLDLETFEALRHWPKAPLPRLGRGEDGAAAIVEVGRRLLGDLTEAADHFVVPLSAGKDSRAVLALLRPTAEAGRPPVKLFTSTGVDFGQRVDVQGARRLAAIAGLPHEVRPREPLHAVPADAVMRNFARLGEAKAGRSLSNPGSLKQSGPTADGPTRITIAGMGGETGRANYWAHDPPAELTALDLLRRVGAPQVPATCAAAERWLEGLPDFVRTDPADTLDFAYVEQRLGCWEANSRYLFPGRPLVISPMTSAFAIETMLRLPKPYRQAGRLQGDIVAQGGPELLAVPFNEPIGTLRFERRARRVVRRVRSRLGL